MKFGTEEEDTIKVLNDPGKVVKVSHVYWLRHESVALSDWRCHGNAFTKSWIKQWNDGRIILKFYNFYIYASKNSF